MPIEPIKRDSDEFIARCRHCNMIAILSDRWRHSKDPFILWICQCGQKNKMRNPYAP